MRPFVISFLSHKGGSGKTTSAINLSTAAHEAGRAVVVVDVDEGASITDWYKIRNNVDALKSIVAERCRAPEWVDDRKDMQKMLEKLQQERILPLVQPTHHAGIASQIEEAERQSVEWIFIDTKGGTERASLSALDVSDLVIMPLIASELDIRQSRDTIRLCRSQEKMPLAVLVDFDAVGPEEDDARTVLAQAGVEVAPGGLGHRKAYKRCVSAGLGVVEYEPRGEAAKEVRSLYKYVCGVVERKNVSTSSGKRVRKGRT